jgi:hypothetical protein
MAVDFAAKVVDANFRVFGRAATYTPPAGSPVAVTAIRKTPDGDISGSFGMTVVGPDAAADIRVAELAAPVEGASLAFTDTTFTVRGAPRRDSEGLVWTLDLAPA